MEKNQLRQFFGAFLTILGTVVILFTLVAFLYDGKPVLGMVINNFWKALPPFIVGILFFGAGVSIINNS